MANQVPRIGVIGLGAMGTGVARSLLRGGFEVHVCDLRKEAVQQIIDAGGHGAASPAALGAVGDALIILVVNAQQTEGVFFDGQGGAPTLHRGSMVLTSATVGPGVARKMGGRVEALGLELMCAP